MGYPQPDPNQNTTIGQKIFRLRTQIVSPGDTYDSTQSGFAFAVGPDSDLANIGINYFDDTIAPTFMNQAAISPGAPFIGKIDVRNEQSYQPSGVPGRIIFSPIDAILPITPTTQNIYTNGIGTIVIPPILDIVQYLSQPPANIPATRNDRHYFFGPPAISAPGALSILVPYYGRNYACISLDAVGESAARQIALTIWGLKFGPGSGNSGPTSTNKVQLLAQTVANTVLTHELNADTDGQWDYLQLDLTNKGNVNPQAGAYLDLRFSDTPQ